LARRVAVQASTFLIVPYLLTGTTRIATVPKRMAAELARIRPLRVLKPSVEIPGFTMCQAWHELHRNDRGHSWLRDALVNAAKGKPSMKSGSKLAQCQIRVDRLKMPSKISRYSVTTLRLPLL
jgi:LysR family transcriptional regulator, nod-box dependent transcriptional activator